MKIVWKQQTVTKMPAETVYNELVKIESDNRGEITPELVVKAATPKRAKLHPCFEWDDKIAAGCHRVSQAREMLRKICIVYDDDKKENNTIRALVNIKEEDRSYYTTTARVVEDEALQENVTDQIVGELLAVKKKYAQWKSPKLQQIWSLVDELIVDEK